MLSISDVEPCCSRQARTNSHAQCNQSQHKWDIGQRRRRWTNSETALAQCIVYAVMLPPLALYDEQRAAQWLPPPLSI